MIAPETLEQIRDRPRRSQIAKDLDQLLAQVLAGVTTLFHYKSQKVWDRLIRIVNDGVQESMIEAGEALLGGAQQVVGGDTRILLRTEDQISFYRGQRDPNHPQPGGQGGEPGRLDQKCADSVRGVLRHENKGARGTALNRAYLFQSAEQRRPGVFEFGLERFDSHHGIVALLRQLPDARVDKRILW